MRFKKAYRKEFTKDVAIVTDEGEYPIWEKDYERLFSSLMPGDEIRNSEELVQLAVRRQIKKSAVKKISAGNITRNALVRRITREKMFDIYPDRVEVEYVVDKLERAGFINDKSYAARFVENACTKLWGEYKIRSAMRERGFRGEDIDEALYKASPDWEELARAFCGEHPDEERAMLFRKLQARGFSTSVISSVLDGE
ncbi:MAG: regulatory protein RecX [Clostridia bacterium]|nr:regulatory protein RecX [Clostridia bacterium]